MDVLLVILEAAVVLGAIVMGVRTGGIGLGLWGVFGTLVLVFVFRLPPGSPPVDAFFIVIAVITAASAMQAAGGIDYLVAIASRIIQANPRRLTYVAPLVAFAFTALAGTSNIFFALIPVIYETAFRNGQRPERSLAASTVTSALGITASPVSAAMAAYLVLASPFSLVQILAITIPASIVACIATSFVQQRIGKELLDDPEFLKRVADGTVEMPAVLAARQQAHEEAVSGGASHAAATRQAKKASAAVPDSAEKILHEVPAGGATSAWIFIVAILAVVLMGLFPALRPAFPNADGELVPIGMSPVIEMVMFTAALVIILVRRVPPGNIVSQPLMSSGIVAAIALFGIAWMADTFISANEKTIVEPLGGLVTAVPILLAVALFFMAGLTTSQSATTNTIVPIALAAGMPIAVVTAMWPSLVGVWLFPANGSQIAAVQTDLTGSTRLSPIPIWHSFTIPMLVSWVSVVAAGLLMSLIVH